MQLFDPPKIREFMLQGLDKARAMNADLEEAYTTYITQYGKDKISVSESLNLAETVDPAALILGRNCTVFYNDYSKKLKGRLGSLALDLGEVYIIGRRQPQDSKLVVWNSRGQTELESYNASVGTILSRIHASIGYIEEKQVLFTDLGSSSGSVIVGESISKGGFVRIYDPGTAESPSIKCERVSTTKRAS
ncbi:MAG: FHA domain-containing protein [Nitrososphaerota archaeon]|nr:FHA domain-containing protein [Nitrososphaerota archaeon]MDG6923993.1 FHA domain-containing protein [Nitrososphaerota archaeon]